MSTGDSRSPSYPQMGLTRCLDLLRRLYEGIHRGAVGTAEAQQMMGFTPRSGSGLAALSALKRFGLIDGRDPTIRITNLGMSILEPINAQERRSAIKEAAYSPPLFAEMVQAFGGKLPADPVIRAKLVREKGFTSSGVDAFIRSLRDTVSLVHSEGADEFEHVTGIGPTHPLEAGTPSGDRSQSMSPIVPLSAPPAGGEVIRLRVSPETTVFVSFDGPVTRENMAKLSRLIEVLSDSYD
jgi:hypothetical protein